MAKIAVLPGDGIGPEIMAEAQKYWKPLLLHTAWNLNLRRTHRRSFRCPGRAFAGGYFGIGPAE